MRNVRRVVGRFCAGPSESGNLRDTHPPSLVPVRHAAADYLPRTGAFASTLTALERAPLLLPANLGVTRPCVSLRYPVSSLTIFAQVLIGQKTSHNLRFLCSDFS
jgi:hypothetical protein